MWEEEYVKDKFPCVSNNVTAAHRTDNRLVTPLRQSSGVAKAADFRSRNSQEFGYPKSKR